MICPKFVVLKIKGCDPIHSYPKFRLIIRIFRLEDARIYWTKHLVGTCILIGDGINRSGLRNAFRSCHLSQCLYLYSWYNGTCKICYNTNFIILCFWDCVFLTYTYGAHPYRKRDGWNFASLFNHWKKNEWMKPDLGYITGV